MTSQCIMFFSVVRISLTLSMINSQKLHIQQIGICKLTYSVCSYFCSTFFQSKNYAVLKYLMHCDVISMIFAYRSKRNFSRKKQDNELL